ncbi:oxygenase MpaB family protein [Runella slithyformis]|uniref:ER-bound oxygenase mpaB/mpaB'/Rubber oxygenase catalytic domain-containing protein n=1 Tax=Runella slithyformis (strain ATCC 29530 / DSM 19594 / LMG 11500 / NCIMB 11436 / LSU 4) TaxID=761193 RepID=A0A7U3ZPU3_RUNSL|nr:oxygenase MpaB family protein [Runella slithyformis]AEI51152.1 hypothetical protein Runsl_4840 [Runella slithyformis DSM 19594]
MDCFVAPDSVVRKIWGKADTILFIFAGAAAEFALNKAVDWLYYTGKLPADPLGRLFSTVSYARRIVFAEYSEALFAIDKITSIHRAVEQQRAEQIPDWAYRDVLFMLIDYSIRSFELLERPLTQAEKEETFDVFYRVGIRMGINGLPTDYAGWQQMRVDHLRDNLRSSEFTVDLYRQYRKHLGPVRYFILKQSQRLVVPQQVNVMLRLGKFSLFTGVISAYKLLRFLKAEQYLKNLILPEAYKSQIAALDTAESAPKREYSA